VDYVSSLIRNGIDCARDTDTGRLRIPAQLRLAATTVCWSPTWTAGYTSSHLQVAPIMPMLNSGVVSAVPLLDRLIKADTSVQEVAHLR
jgi:hypothetical protein